MNKIRSLIVLIISLAVLSSCKKVEPELLSSGDFFVKFENSTLSVSEKSSILKIPVQVADINREGNVTVSFDVATVEGYTAKEGVDFTIENQTKVLTFQQNQYVDTIVIKSIDNSVRTGDVLFKLELTSNSANYAIGLDKGTTGNAIDVTIVDDEHPLAKWIGSYSVYCDSYGDVANGKPEGAWDEEWKDVVISADPSNVNNLLIKGIAGSAVNIVAVVGLTDNSITIAKGQDLGDVYGYGKSLLYKGTNVAGIVNQDIVGVVNSDGSIVIDMFAILEVDENFVWDSFKTTWTKK